MNQTQAFRAWRYNPNKISDLSQVIAPPYDVIGPNKLKELQQRSPHNVVYMDLSQEENGLEKYQVAAQYWKAWKQAQVLVQDPEPCLYLYSQSFSLPDGTKRIRKGFFARRKLEDFAGGSVRPHEKTFAGPKADRFQLMQATAANLSPVFGLFSDPRRQIQGLLEEFFQTPADIRIQEDKEQTHELWILKDPAKIKVLLQNLDHSSILIADGHHRYETALNYRNLRQQQLGKDSSGEENFNYVLMYFCSLQDPGLVVLPTHRVLSQRPAIGPDELRQKLIPYAQIKTFSTSQASQAVEWMQARSAEGTQLGWIHDQNIEVLSFDLERLKSVPCIQKLSKALQQLDVTILHTFVLQELLGLSESQQAEYGAIQYLKNTEDALKLTAEKNSYSFLMNATPVEQVEAVTVTGETMPQKSTFFYPKLPTGLLFYDLS